MIKISSLEKFFNKGRENEIHVINDITLELPSSGMVAIFGRSGCGKTTLLNVLGGLDGFDGGSVTIDGCDIKKNTDDIRNKYIGYIFQNYNLSKGESCFENVANALRLCGMRDESEIESRVNAALLNVGMEKFAKRSPDTLSGGQQQRIAIARAIVKNPAIILADEPTGNLDEANTVKIMDLIKAISRDRLVILVTHEANLVDHYCDTVIELADGKVVDIKNNDSAEGVKLRDKNTIYLGDLERKDISTSEANIEYYGEAPASPLKIKVVNNGGKLYLKIDTPKLQLLDDTSEIKLVESSFAGGLAGIPAGETGGDESFETKEARVMDISPLPPTEVKRTGRLFDFKSCVKSGYRENFKGGKKGRRFMRVCLALFAAVVVFMCATFGTAFTNASAAKERYSKNTFYVYSKDPAVSQKLLDASKNPDTGIDFIKLIRTYPLEDVSVSFNVGSFETFTTDTYDVFESDPYSKPFVSNAVLMDTTVSDKLTLLCGKKNISENEVIITSALADRLIKNSSVGYVKEYDDTIGFLLKLFVNGKRPTVAGVVESDEAAVFFTPLDLAKYENSYMRAMIYPASDYGLAAEEGKVIYVRAEDEEVLADGTAAKIFGKDFTVSKTLVVTEETAGSMAELRFVSSCYLVSDEDYILLSKITGESDERISIAEANDYHYTDNLLIPKELLYYTAVHSTSPEVTEAWIASSFTDIKTDMEELPAYMTPDGVYSEMIKEYKSGIAGGIISITVVIVLMSLCMYFIMRSSLIARIKEIGIYRAIGVSKKNLVFKFFTEAMILASLTVLIGYVLSGAFIYACLGLSSLVKCIFFYPLWMALAVLVILLAITAASGILPVLLLLRKRPSEILAKYDI